MWNKGTDGDFGVLTDADMRGDNNINLLCTINDGGEPCYVFCGGLREAVKYVYMPVVTSYEMRSPGKLTRCRLDTACTVGVRMGR